MKKLFILLTLIGGTGASAFAMGNDAVRDFDRTLSQPKKEVPMNVLAMGNDAVRDFDRTLSQPTKEVPMNVLAMGNDAVRDHDRIIAQANTIA